MYNQEIEKLKQYLKEEYVGYQDKKEIINNMDFCDINVFFIDITEQLNKLHDSHVRLIDKMNHRKLTLLCKKADNRLYVDHSIHPEISRGTEIIALGQFSISDIIEREKHLLFDPNPQRYELQHVLRKYQTVTLEYGEQKTIFIENEQELYDETYIIEQRGTYCYIRLPDFKNVGTIHEVIQNNRDTLTNSSKFIIDVRDNRGGSDFAYFPLLEYIFLPHFTLDTGYNLTFNYTKRYCDYMIEKVNKDLAEMNEGETKQVFTEYRDRMIDNYAKGLVKFPDDTESVIIDGIAEDIKVIVIANERCGSSGDNFVVTVQNSPFVTVIGSATKGMNDYANCGYLNLNNEFDLLCPYSRYNGLNHGQSMALVGIKPNIEILWTPEELKYDVLMRKAEHLL